MGKVANIEASVLVELGMMTRGSVLVPQRRTFLSLLLLGFYGGFSPAAQLAIAIDSTFSPPPPPKSGGGMKVSPWLVPLATSPPSLGHCITRSPGVVERSLLRITQTPVPPAWPDVMSGTEDNRPNGTKDAPVALRAQRIPRVLGAVSQEPWVLSRHSSL